MLSIRTLRRIVAVKRKTWVILTLIWISVCVLGLYNAFSQSNQFNNNQTPEQKRLMYVEHVSYDGHRYGWKCENEGQWGSFWWKIERTRQKEPDGYYYYYVYFYSNSYLVNNNNKYLRAISYIEGVNIIMKGKTIKDIVEIELPYVLADWEAKYVAYFYSTTIDSDFFITWENVYPYDYSKK